MKSVPAARDPEMADLTIQERSGERLTLVDGQVAFIEQKYHSRVAIGK